MERLNKPAAIFFIRLKCFITVSVGMVQVIRYHRQNMKISIINGSEVSGLSVEIHIAGERNPSLCRTAKWKNRTGAGRSDKHRATEQLFSYFYTARHTAHRQRNCMHTVTGFQRVITHVVSEPDVQHSAVAIEQGTTFIHCDSEKRSERACWVPYKAVLPVEWKADFPLPARP